MSAPMVGGTSRKMVRMLQVSALASLSASVEAASPWSVACCSFNSRTLSWNCSNNKCKTPSVRKTKIYARERDERKREGDTVCTERKWEKETEREREREIQHVQRKKEGEREC